MNCADVRAALPALLYGDLSADEMSRVRAHLRDCPSCQQEHAAVAEVRGWLDAVPVPAVSVDLARLYREAAQRDLRRLRRWRRVACVSLAAAAAVVLAVLLSRIEVRLDADQLVLRWGAVPAPPERPVPLPLPREEPLVAAAPSANTAEIEQQLRLLTELVQALSTDADLRDESRQREIAGLKERLQGLQQQMTEQRVATDKDVAALYAAQFPDKQKGASP